MKLEKIAAIAEIISSIAIVFTLIYLAIQTQQMNIQTQQTNNILLSNSRQATLDGDMRLILMAIEYPEAFLNLNSDKELTDKEAQQVKGLLAGHIRVREYAWNQYQAGILEEETWESYLQILIKQITSSKNAAFEWEDLSKGLNPEFVAEVNKRLELATN